MKVCAIVQARMGSERLPRKVMKTVLGKTLLEYEMGRLRRARTVDEVVVATTANPDDRAIADLCVKLSAPCFRGSEENVLERYYEAARWRKAEAVVRVTADCPLIDPEIVDRVVGFYRNHPAEYDYVSNTLQRTFPRGMDCEVFSFPALREAHETASANPEREHVTLFIYNHPKRFRLGSVLADEDHSGHRWTVDTPEDFALIERILTALYPSNANFTMRDVLDLLGKHPEWERINQTVRQKAL